jgi:hypothetical protein
MAALYALCLLAPGVAMAFNGPAAAHCLTEQHGIASKHEHGTKTHVHADGTTHQHADPGQTTGATQHSDGDGKSQPGNCCGLFCMTALSQEVAAFAVTAMNFTAHDPVLGSKLTGQVPEGLNRPPNT